MLNIMIFSTMIFTFANGATINHLPQETRHHDAIEIDNHNRYRQISAFFHKNTTNNKNNTREILLKDDSDLNFNARNNVFLPKFNENDDLTIELALFIDNALYNTYAANYSYSSADYKLQEYVTAVFNDIQLHYLHTAMTPKIYLKIVKYEIFTSQPNELSLSRINNGDAQSYLDAFCLYQYRMPDRTWDHSVLLTGFDLLNGNHVSTISGLSRLSGVCDPYNSCTVLEGLDFTAPLVGAHEIAHALGVNHDEPNCGSRFIMSNSLGAGKIGWSWCSLDDLRKYVAKLDYEGRNCMREISEEKTALNLDGRSLPGQMFPPDDQCTLVFGPGFKRATMPNDHPDSLCHIMWCSQGKFNKITTSHPALEGTSCGDGKYCKHGQCIPFESGSDGSSPRIIHGEWSSWSSVTCDQCFCSPIFGSVGVLASTRTCSNPVPSFGGTTCRGQSIRATVCDSLCDSASVSPKAYVHNVCEARRREKFDLQMTGRGFRSIKSPCKIYCMSRSDTNGNGKNYRYFGDWIPNGSPCGLGKYCANGECLFLGCDETALVFDSTSCPKDYDKCSFIKKDKWGDWSSWSPCTVSCGDGTQQRIRSCTGTKCSGQSQESKPCKLQSCSADIINSDWSQWFPWSPCTKTCGPGGTTERFRTCSAATCPDRMDKEMKECENNDKCPDDSDWSSWTLWTLCSRTCDNGIKTRSRFCLNDQCLGGNMNTQTEYCKMAECETISAANNDNVSPWTQYTPCSVTCGTGTKTRSRQCLKEPCPVLFEQIECLMQTCAEWGGWGEFSDCNLSKLSKRRIRRCYGAFNTCIGNAYEEVPC